MSRSRRKPYFTDQQNNSTKNVKRKGNRKIRQLDEGNTPADGNMYKKEFESWDIRDWNFYAPANKKAYRK